MLIVEGNTMQHRTVLLVKVVFAISNCIKLSIISYEGHVIEATIKIECREYYYKIVQPLSFGY